MLKATLRSLLGRPLRLLMSVMAVILGVAFVAGTFIFTDTLDRSFTSIFSSAVGDVIARPLGSQLGDGSPTGKTMPRTVVDALAHVDGAARADGNVSAVGVYVVGTDGKLIGGLGAPALAGNISGAPAAHGLEGLTLLEGEEPSGPEQVVIDADTVDKSGYQIGDTVQLATTLPDNPVLKPTLVGIIGYKNGASLNGASFVGFDTKTAQQLFLGGKDVFSDAWVTAEPGVTQGELKAKVENSLPYGYEVVTGDEEADRLGGQIMDALGFIQTFLLVFAFIALFVGVFLIINTFSMLVAQRSREMALMRALGASKRQVTGSVVLEASLMGLVGGALGLGLGIGLAKAIMFLFARLGLDISKQPAVVAPRTIIVALLVGVLTTVVASLVPALRAGRVAPVAALRDDATLPESSLHRFTVSGGTLTALGIASLLWGLYGASSRELWYVGGGVLGILLGVSALSTVLARPFASLFGLLYRRTSGFVGDLATENAKRNPRRTAITAAALMIGLTLVTTIATLGASAKQSVADELKKNFAGDLVVSNVFNGAFSSRVGDIAEGLPGVDKVSRMRYVVLPSGNELLPAIDPSTIGDIITLDFNEGSMRALQTRGTVALSSDYAASHHLGVGDVLTLDLPSGKKDFPVSAVFQQNPIVGLPYVVSLDTLSSLGFPKADNALYIIVKDGYDVATVKKQLDEATTDLPMVTVKDQAGFVAEQQGIFDVLLNLVYGLLGLAIVIAVLGIVNTLALSVIERTREVGLLRAVGLDKRQLRRAIRLESVLISVYGALLGTSMGVAFGVVLITALSDQGLSGLVVPWGQIVAFVLAAAVVGVVAAVFPARRAAGFDVLEAIATE